MPDYNPVHTLDKDPVVAPEFLTPIDNDKLVSPRACLSCSRKPEMRKGFLCCPVCGPLWVIERERQRVASQQSRPDWPDPDKPEERKPVLETSSKDKKAKGK